MVLQGHGKWLLNKLLIEKDKDVITTINSSKLNFILKSIKTPHTINRKPTKIEEIIRWKSSEIKLFLFYESIPLFRYILTNNYFYKYATYFLCVRMLYEPIKDKSILDSIQEIFIMYIKDLKETFSIEACTYTIHAHLHLVEQVKLHGPLCCHTQFVFEGALFNLKNLLHGTKGYINQLTKQLFICKDLINRINENKFENEEILNFVNKIYKVDKNKRINHIIGSVQKRKINQNENQLLKIYDNSKDVLIGDKVIINSRIFHSKRYKRKGEYDSYSISYSKDSIINYGQIEYFIEVNNRLYAYVSLYEIDNNYEQFLPQSSGVFFSFVNQYFKHYFKIIKTSCLADIIDCSTILNRCIIIKNEDIMFITEIVNDFEHD